MKQDILNLDNKVVGSIELDKSIFGLEVCADILHRVVVWQLARLQAGTHKTKGRSEVALTPAKPFKQKGGGRARQGSRKGTQFRKGGVVFGPVVREHSHDLTKKFRKLGLKTALSAKAKEGNLVIIDEAKLPSINKLLFNPQAVNFSFNNLVLGSANLASSIITKLPSLALADKAVFKPSLRNFLVKSCE